MKIFVLTHKFLGCAGLKLDQGGILFGVATKPPDFGPITQGPDEVSFLLVGERSE